MSLITNEHREQMLANAEARRVNRNYDAKPVVKLFTPDAGATWLLSELDPDNPDRAYGLCDPGLGSPEIGWVSLNELDQVRGRLGLPVERDEVFVADRGLAAYAREAQQHGVIIT